MTRRAVTGKKRKRSTLAGVVGCCAFTALALTACHLLLDDPDAHYLRTDASQEGAGGDASDGATDAGNTSSPLTDGPVVDGDASTAVVLVRNQLRPGAIRIDDPYLYWINEGTDGGNGSVMRALKDGGTPTVLVSGRHHPADLRVAAINLLFSDDADEPDGGTTGADVGVFRAPKGTGSPVEKMSNDGLGAGALAIRSGYLWSDAWGPGLPARLRKNLLTAIVPDECFVYVGASSPGRVRDVFVDDTDAFLIDTSSSAILRASLDCDAGTTATRTFAANQPGARALSSDSVHIFWITPSAVYRQDKDGGAPLLLANDGISLSDLNATGELVVYADEGRGTISYTNFSFGGLGFVMTDKQGGPRSVITDDTFVYFTNRTSGEVVRMPLPSIK